MSNTDIEPTHARAIVESRLGRAPQDMLEAAVVLEAWGGLPAAAALGVGRRITRDTNGVPHPSQALLPPAERRGSVALEALALVASIIAIACWATPLSEALGAAAVQTTLRIALPFSIALQWALSSRYLSRPDGTAHLGDHPLALALVPAGMLIVTASIGGESGMVAALLTITWVAGTILIASGRAVAYVTAILAATAALVCGLSVIPVLSVVASTTTIVVILSVTRQRARHQPSREPGRWSRSALAAGIGCAIGAMLIADASVDWSLGAVPAVGLLPSTLAGVWAGVHLWRLHEVLPQSLVGVPAWSDSPPTTVSTPRGLLGGAMVRLCGVTATLSVLLVLGAHMLDVHTSNPAVLAGFGLIALATLLVGLLEALGHGIWALWSLVSGVVLAWALPHITTRLPSGGALIVGTATVVILTLPRAVACLDHSAVTLATRLRVT
jgi:hypothetical protein